MRLFFLEAPPVCLCLSVCGLSVSALSVCVFYLMIEEAACSILFEFEGRTLHPGRPCGGVG
jgi:hypothetical protein